MPDFYSLEYNGKPTGGIFGHLQTINNIKASSPHHKVISVWDKIHSPRRKTLYPAYKANRKPTNEEDRVAKELFFENFNYQKNIIKTKFNPALGIQNCEFQEGDDLIFKICEMYHEQEQIFVVSEDKDLLQLIMHFPTVKVYQPIKKILVDTKNFEEVTEVKIQLFLLYKALIGDKSDGISGIFGVGETTVKKLLKNVDYKDMTNSLLKIVQDQYNKETQVKNPKPLSRIAKIYTGWGTIATNLDLMDLSREVFPNAVTSSLKVEIDNFKLSVNVEQFKSLCTEYGFNSILNNFDYFMMPFAVNAGL